MRYATARSKGGGRRSLVLLRAHGEPVEAVNRRGGRSAARSAAATTLRTRRVKSRTDGSLVCWGDRGNKERFADDEWGQADKLYQGQFVGLSFA